VIFARFDPTGLQVATQGHRIDRLAGAGDDRLLRCDWSPKKYDLFSLFRIHCGAAPMPKGAKQQACIALA